MHFIRKTLPLLALTTLLTGVLPSARAAILTCTLSGVTFTDGATATGFFNYDQSTSLFSGYNITTTTGVTDTLTGAHYTPAAGFVNQVNGAVFIFNGGSTPNINGNSANTLILNVFPAPDHPGTFPLVPGVVTAGGLNDSGEAAGTGTGLGFRAINKGSISVTPFVAAVPEPSPWIAFAFTGLGVGGLMFRARKRGNSRL